MATRILLLALALVLAVPSADARVRAVAAENGSGTTDHPPYAPLGYQSPDEISIIVNGLPGGSQLIGRLSVEPSAPGAWVPGGSLGGRRQVFGGRVHVRLVGTGALAGYVRTVTMPINTGETHTAPIVTMGTTQQIATDLFMLQSQIIGDPDFDLLRITGGTNFGLPSPGGTRLDLLPSGDWHVDSFFDITYRVDFVGAPGGPFAGMSGSTVQQTRLQEGRSIRDLCVAPDIGGTAQFPANCGPYQSDPEVDLIRDGLPTGAALTGRMFIRSILPYNVFAGGSLGGQVQQWNATMVMELRGSGWAGGYARTVFIPLNGETVSALQLAGNPVQGFATELQQLFGQILGDPDFDLLRITAGTSFGLPSRGHTTLTQLPGGDWAVDSFFDITYRIDFVGAPGGPFAGLSGSTVSECRMEQGGPVEGFPCIVPDNGAGTADLPPSCPSGHESPTGILLGRAGLPPASPFLGSIRLANLTTVLEGPGGGLGGTLQHFTGTLDIVVEGQGFFAGYSRAFTVLVGGKSDAALRVSGMVPQSVPMRLLELQGQVVGDPDFDLLRITTGNNFGLPAPGHTLLTQPGFGTWQVDSFFDITYRVDFIGAPGGPFAGLSGSEAGAARIRAGWLGGTADAAEAAPRVGPGLGPAVPNPTVAASTVDFRLEAAAPVRARILDVAGRLVRTLVDTELPAGEHRLTWDGTDDAGRPAASGLYFYRVERGGDTSVTRVVLQR
jgi:hypothetical protein